MYKFFEEFVKKMAASIRWIAKSTKYEVTAEGLQNDAWIIAHDISFRTVEVHRARIFEKMNVRKAVELSQLFNK